MHNYETPGEKDPYYSFIAEVLASSLDEYDLQDLIAAVSSAHRTHQQGGFFGRKNSQQNLLESLRQSPNPAVADAIYHIQSAQNAWKNSGNKDRGDILSSANAANIQTLSEALEKKYRDKFYK